MFKATVKNATRGHALNSLCLTAALFAIAPLAFAQTGPTAPPPPTECGSTNPGGSGNLCDEIAAPFVATGQTCGFDRGATGCTANDFVGQANVTSNTLSNCHNGDVLTNQALSFTIQSSQSKRYAPALFIGEQNQPLNATGGTCSVATFPTTSTNPPGVTPYPWFAANVGDVCGSYSASFTSIEQLDGVSFVCDPDVNGNLQVTFMVLYAQNSNDAATCTGPGTVAPGTTSKCEVGGTPVTNVVVTFNANPTCSLSGNDGITIGDGTFTKTFTITNNGPDDAGVPGSNSIHFDDPVPVPFSVTSATCTAAGGAVCPATFPLGAGNDVGGDIPTLPNGGSLHITITGTFPSGNQSAFDNVVTLTNNNPTAVITPTQPLWVNTCDVASTLPVKLQNFDVK